MMSQTKEELGTQIVDAIQGSVLKLAQGGGLIATGLFGRDRATIPKDLVQKVIDSIDADAVVANLKPRINKLVADRILSSIRQSVVEQVKEAMTEIGRAHV